MTKIEIIYLCTDSLNCTQPPALCMHLTPSCENNEKGRTGQIVTFLVIPSSQQVNYNF